MMILKWISIILFLLAVIAIIIEVIATFFIAINEIISTFKKYPEIGKRWLKNGSYYLKVLNGYPCVYDGFRAYKTKDGNIIEVNEKDGEMFYNFKIAIENLLIILTVIISLSILLFGCYNTIILFELK